MATAAVYTSPVGNPTASHVPIYIMKNYSKAAAAEQKSGVAHLNEHTTLWLDLSVCNPAQCMDYVLACLTDTSGLFRIKKPRTVFAWGISNLDAMHHARDKVKDLRVTEIDLNDGTIGLIFGWNEQQVIQEYKGVTAHQDAWMEHFDFMAKDHPLGLLDLAFQTMSGRSEVPDPLMLTNPPYLNKLYEKATKIYNLATATIKLNNGDTLLLLSKDEAKIMQTSGEIEETHVRAKEYVQALLDHDPVELVKHCYRDSVFDSAVPDPLILSHLAEGQIKKILAEVANIKGLQVDLMEHRTIGQALIISFNENKIDAEVDKALKHWDELEAPLRRSLRAMALPSVEYSARVSAKPVSTKRKASTSSDEAAAGVDKKRKTSETSEEATSDTTSYAQAIASQQDSLSSTTESDKTPSPVSAPGCIALPATNTSSPTSSEEFAQEVQEVVDQCLGKNELL